MDQGSNKNHSPAYNFAPTVTKFCVMWEGQALPHDTKFGNCRCKIVDSRSFHSWSLIHGLRWSGLIKVGPACHLHWYMTPNEQRGSDPSFNVWLMNRTFGSIVLAYVNIDAEKKWPWFCRHFQINLLVWKLYQFNWSFIEIHFQWSN